VSTALSAFLPFVLPHALGCPDFAAKQEILRAAIKFCEQTRAWKAVMDPVDIVAETATYAIPTPTGAQCVIVEEVYYDGIEITPKTPDQLKEHYPNWLTKTGTPQFYTQLDPDNLTLSPIPEDALADGLVVRGTFAPARTATVVPDLLFNQYVDAIADGAIAELCATPGKPWTNPETAAYRAGLFQRAIDSTKAQVAKAFTRAPNRVRLRTF
jgi:hypothetical protein